MPPVASRECLESVRNVCRDPTPQHTFLCNTHLDLLQRGQSKQEVSAWQRRRSRRAARDAVMEAGQQAQRGVQRLDGQLALGEAVGQQPGEAGQACAGSERAAAAEWWRWAAAVASTARAGGGAADRACKCLLGALPVSNRLRRPAFRRTQSL